MKIIDWLQSELDYARAEAHFDCHWLIELPLLAIYLTFYS